MAERPNEDSVHDTIVVRRNGRWGRIASLVALGLLIALIIGVAIVWTQRRSIATHYLKSELERRGVAATYHLDRVGLRTQEVSDLVIGDPKRPDLIAKYAHIETRLKWNGSFEVYRIVARGVRLRGKLVNGRVSWGQIDKLMPPPSNKPFALPDFVLNVADSTISLSTPFGPLGFALAGNGKLSGGFKGNAVVISPQLVPGKCAAVNMRAAVAVSVTARRPRIDGPVTLDRFSCPVSRFDIASPRFDAKATFNESFTSIDGSGRMAIATLIAGANGLANFVGDISYKGSFGAVAGKVKLSAQKSRVGTIYADRTRLAGDYALGIRSGEFRLAGQYGADSGALDPSMTAGVTGPLAAAAKTPIGPVTTAIGNAVLRTARNFNSAGHIKVVNFPGGGAVRITDANIIGPGGARAKVTGGSGVTYYWPSGGLRIDGDLAMNGGGLPQAEVSLRQPRAGAPMSGVANLAPYAANGQRLALTPIRFGPGPGGVTTVSTIAQLDGRFPNGRVQALRLPIDGQVGKAGSFAVGTSCAVVSFNYLQVSSLQLGTTRLPVCPIGTAMIRKNGDGPVIMAANLAHPVLNGSIGKSPLRLQAANGQLTGQQFVFSRMGMSLGRSASPVLFNAARLTGNFGGKNLNGAFADAGGTIGNVPLQLSDASGKWQLVGNKLGITSALTVSDRDANPRFYPLRSDNIRFSLAGDYIRADGLLRHPASGTPVTSVDIEHRLSNGAGHADLNIPGLTFGPSFQPAELTRLTEGVIALVEGTIQGHGRIDWNSSGKVTSTGDFSTADLNLAAPFGPVTGIKGNMHFTDLLGLTTAPGQTFTVASINPGILVENGVIRYQLLPGQLVKVERGEWPFMGGRLILQETVLNFNHPTAKRLTFRVEGLDAHTFVSTLGFKEIDATGRFDGVLPMIFDENGGRIVGGRLDSRPGGGSLAYVGTVSKSDLGIMGNIAFNALRDIRFKAMTIRLDGDLAGEFAARLNVDGAGLGQSTGTQRLIKRLLKKIPLHLNVSITGPFRALIATAKSMQDPRTVISDVLPRPLGDVPGITTEVRKLEDEQQQTQTPVPEQVNVAPPNPTPTKTK
ncbi:intermembrane phospholipid transport protein YdbH family protein [Sphingomonas flavescens]|uniref:intermembrane phospholipid transport protein YdbH family protein n=1 Tax=Sphingomonas flavescens TaxID=3132797 RepID=UPI002805F5DD|nr:YdbH domain-containing protein [Sphingomonas limnosediminicola]